MSVQTRRFTTHPVALKRPVGDDHVRTEKDRLKGDWEMRVVDARPPLAKELLWRTRHKWQAGIDIAVPSTREEALD